MDKDLLALARQKIDQAERITVFSHIRPDGDAVGSLVGLGLALEKKGKLVQMVLKDGVPDKFRFLSGSEKIVKKYDEPMGLIITVDSSDLLRVAGDLPSGCVPDINIDHHISNTRFGKINLVDPEAAATAEILSQNLINLGLEWTLMVANALLLGIITDTIGFRTNNVRSETLRQAAILMDLGAKLPEIYKKTLSQRKLTDLRYWGAGLSSLQQEGKIIWATLTLSDRREAQYPGRDDADLINLLSEVPEADISIVFVEQDGGSVKISWRAQDGYDVSKVAALFGGGGHRAAAGAEIKGSLDKIKENVLVETKLLMKEVNLVIK